MAEGLPRHDHLTLPGSGALTGTCTGAQALVATLGDAGVQACFTNPGTTEIHLLGALDARAQIRLVLALFEGVATGAADGYARMLDRPAVTLLHLGPGLANGLANLHNARRAQAPVVNLVGDHATSHVRFDAPLQSDIETAARSVSAWVRRARSAQRLPEDARDALLAAARPPGQVATLIVPADLAWAQGAAPAPAPRPQAAPAAPGETVERVAARIRSGRPGAILLGGGALRARGLMAAGRIAAVTGARLLAERHAARAQRGAGLPAVERLEYWPESARAQLEGLEVLILAGARPPVSFFAYPGSEGTLQPGGCEIAELSPPRCDPAASLEALAEALDAASAQPVLQERQAPPAASGPLTARSACQVIGALLPEGAIVCDESITCGMALPQMTAGAPRHDWLTLAGGAIGQGLPLAVGAAVACPDRPVIALEADGSAMYTLQALWTMAREQLDVTVIVFNNRCYGILEIELGRLGVACGPRARAQLSLADPDLDFVSLASGMGVPARRVKTAEALADQLRRALAEPGPALIEAVIAPVRAS